MEPSKYTGYAGQLAVMSELTMRGYNVASPGIDMGDDVFVMNEETGKLDRIQVKASRPNTKASRNKKGRVIYEFLVHKPRITKNLSRAGADSYFIFAMVPSRWPKSWTYVIIPRMVLADKVKEFDLGTKGPRKETIRLSIEIFPDGKVSFFQRDVKIPLDTYLNIWEQYWPPISTYDM